MTEKLAACWMFCKLGVPNKDGLLYTEDNVHLLIDQFKTNGHKVELKNGGELWVTMKYKDDPDENRHLKGLPTISISTTKNLILVANVHELIDNLEYGIACKLLEAMSDSKANEFCEFFLTGDALGNKWKVCSRNRKEVKAFLANPELFVIGV